MFMKERRQDEEYAAPVGNEYIDRIEEGGGFLRVYLKQGAKVLFYQSEMIYHNPHPGIIPVQIKNEDGKTALYFRTGESLKLVHYFHKKKLAGQELLAILEAITSVLLAAPSYLLSESGFLLNTDYVYFRPAENTAYLVYLPLDIKRLDMHSNYHQFYTDILGLAKLKEDEETVYCRALLLRFLRDDTFSLRGMQEMIKGLRLPGGKKGRTDAGKMEKPFQLGPDKSEKTFCEEKESAKNNKRRNSRFVGLFLFVMLQFVVLVFLNRMSTALALLGDVRITYLGIGLVLAAVDMFIIQRLFVSFAGRAQPAQGGREMEESLTAMLAREKGVLKEELKYSYFQSSSHCLEGEEVE